MCEPIRKGHCFISWSPEEPPAAAALLPVLEGPTSSLLPVLTAVAGRGRLSDGRVVLGRAPSRRATRCSDSLGDAFGWRPLESCSEPGRAQVRRTEAGQGNPNKKRQCPHPSWPTWRRQALRSIRHVNPETRPLGGGHAGSPRLSTDIERKRFSPKLGPDYMLKRRYLGGININSTHLFFHFSKGGYQTHSNYARLIVGEIQNKSTAGRSGRRG